MTIKSTFQRGLAGVCLALFGQATAAAIVFVVAEIYERDVTNGTARIKNPGGYFRSFVRMMAEGRISLASELRRLLR